MPPCSLFTCVCGSRVRVASQVASLILYPIWFAVNLMVIKKRIILQQYASSRGRALVLNRIADYVLSSLTVMFVFDILSVQLGVGLKSFFAFGGLSTVVVGLACQGPVSQLVAGLVLTFNDKLRVGDEVAFGDGTAGIIVSVGWADTVMRQYDEGFLSIPNAEVAGQRIHNISRDVRSQVKMSIRLRYEDLDRIEQVQAMIKEEVAASCPSVIVDGTRPFWVHFKGYEKDHIVVLCDFHFNIRQKTTASHDNTQKVGLAVKRGVDRAGAKFQLPQRISLGA